MRTSLMSGHRLGRIRFRWLALLGVLAVAAILVWYR